MMTYHTSRHNKVKSGLVVAGEIAKATYGGRVYKLLSVRAGETNYLCLRLYNAQNHFIKQFLFEPELARWLMDALYHSQTGG